MTSVVEQHTTTLLLINPSHPLLPITKSTLRQVEGHRPPMESISESLAQLKTKTEYLESARRENETPSEVSKLKRELGEVTSQLREREQEITKLRGEVEEMKRHMTLQEQEQGKERTTKKL